jgi:hypothetical protein
MKKFVKAMALGLMLAGLTTVAKADNFAGITLGVTLDGNLTVTIVGSTNTTFGTVTLGSSKVSTGGIEIKNDSSGVNLTYELSSFDSAPLTLASAAGANAFALKALFNNTASAAPVLADFGAQDAIFPNNTFVKATVAAGNGKFEGDNNGVNVAPAAVRRVWFRFDAPTTSSSVGTRELAVTVLGNL